jgi:ubiquinone/menaquinone biosynthesis C-methylase UbiE
MKEEREHVCPVELAGSFDFILRRWLQNPVKILSPYVEPGMKVLDVGCGPGFFSIEAAKLVGTTGKVYAADLQQGMLNKIEAKIKGTALEKTIILHKTKANAINLNEKVDFILAFYMVHEVPFKDKFFAEIKTLLLENGKVLVAEPFGHVTKKGFEEEMSIALKCGFKVSTGYKLSFGRFAVLTH